MVNRKTCLALLSLMAVNTAFAATLSITSPVTDAVVGDAITMSGACNTGSVVRADVRDSNNLLSAQKSVTCAASKYSVAVSSTGLVAGTLRLRALSVVNGATQTSYVYVKKNAPAKAAATALTLVIENPLANAAINTTNQAAVVVNGTCTAGTAIQINATDSAGKVLPTQWTGCNEVSDFHGQLDLTSLKDGNISIKAYVEANGTNKTALINVVKTTAAPLTALKIEAPAANAAVTTDNQAAFAIAGKCADKLVMKLQATDSANKLSEITWIMCENSGFWGPINMTSLKDGNISVRAFQEVNGVMQNQYVTVVKNTTPVAPPLAVTLGTLASVKEGVASSLTVNKVAGTAAGTVTYQVLNNASKAVLSSGSLVFAAADTAKTISVLAPEDTVYNADMKLEIKVGTLASLIVPVVDNDPVPTIGLKILAPAANFAVNASNQASVEVSGKCNDALVMKLQATDSAGALSEITWIMCENSNFWGPINMTALKDGNISVRAFQEVNGVMQNQYVNVVKNVGTVTPALAVTLGTLASVKEGVASNLTVNKVSGTAAGTVAYQVLNNASKAVISSGSLVFAAADTSKTISVLAPDDAVYNADMKLEIKVGTLASLIVPVVDNDPVPPVSSTKIMMGINGHDNFPAYPANEIEARVKYLADRNIRSFRNGGDSASQEPLWPTMDALIAAGKKYNVTIRPALYHWLGEAQAYKIAKRFPDIRVWEIGNEVDGDEGNEAQNIALMVQVYKGIKRAAAEMGVEIKTTINVMACYSASPGRCYNKADGSGYFVDAAWAAGFKFDYISFHYYPYYTDKGAMYSMYLGQMRLMAQRYNVKILFNETNCAEIYPWSVTTGNVTDGGFAGDKRCYDSLKQLLTELNTNYKDIVQEINIYEMLDEPNHEVTHEKHFGMMYDMNNPKPVFDMVINQFAK